MMYWVQHEELKPPAQWWGGTVAAAQQGNYGIVSAIDLRTGRIAWQTKLDKPIISGLAATAGGVVFTGTSDKKVIALDAKTGRQLWSYSVNAGVNAPPISYEVHGVQYVAVAATGIQTLNTPRGDEMVAFTLPHQGPAGASIPNVLGPNPDTSQIDIGAGTPAPGAPKPDTGRAKPTAGDSSKKATSGDSSRRTPAADSSKRKRP
jgi:outer membrane protein assembly factor BamB